MTPQDFTLSIQDFDLYLLPEDSRDIHSEAFRAAVAAFYAQQFAPLGGMASVAFEGDNIHVSWMPEDTSQHPFEYAIALLQAGEFQKAVPILETLLSSDPTNVDILFNFGMAESDSGHLGRATDLLKRAVEVDPQRADAWAALGIAHQRNSKSEEALLAMERAVQIDPEYGVARRNLGGLLNSRGLYQEAEPHLRAAVRLLPGEQSALYGLAHCLEQLGGEERGSEADLLYQQVIAIDADSDIAEAAMTASRNLAQQTFRSKGGVPIRMDAVQYCLGAMQRFASMDMQQIQNIVFEIALLGRSGFDVNSPDKRYTLKSLPGDYSGLHLVSIMYTGFKKIAPDADAGFDLSAEYAVAQNMFGGKQGTR